MEEETKKKSHQLINQDSGKTNYYTPGYILVAAQSTMGSYMNVAGRKCSFHLDPASDHYGNQHVNADWYFTEQTNGLIHSWVAETVWMNHPYSREGNPKWINKAVSEYEKGNAKQICMITWASTSEKWFHPLFRYPMCFLNKRVRFIDPNQVLKHGSTKSSVVTYMGPNITRFIECFSDIGHVVVPPTVTTNMTFRDYEFGANCVPEGYVNDFENITRCAMGLAATTGRVVQSSADTMYNRKPMNHEKLVDELAATLHALAHVSTAWGHGLEEIAKYTVEKIALPNKKK